ncbi:hypothetical protein ACFX13_027298 [Malus domestica]
MCLVVQLHQLADVVVNLIFPVPDVNTQTTVKVKVVNKAEDEPESFAWSWRPETIDDTRLLAMGEGTANQLMDQKEAGNDSGDSLWYMTSVHLKKYEPIWSKNRL